MFNVLENLQKIRFSNLEVKYSEGKTKIENKLGNLTIWAPLETTNDKNIEVYIFDETNNVYEPEKDIFEMKLFDTFGQLILYLREQDRNEEEARVKMEALVDYIEMKIRNNEIDKLQKDFDMIINFFFSKENRRLYLFSDADAHYFYGMFEIARDKSKIIFISNNLRKVIKLQR